MPAFDRESDWHQGYEDALSNLPRAIGGTRSGYRAGYDKGLSDALARPQTAPIGRRSSTLARDPYSGYAIYLDEF